MHISWLSGFVLFIAGIFAILSNLLFLKGFRSKSQKQNEWSQYYDENLHRVMDNRDVENTTGCLCYIIGTLLLLLASILIRFGL